MPFRPFVRRVRPAGVLLALVAAWGTGCTRRPDFDPVAAQREIAAALDRSPQQIAVYGEARGDEPDEWIVEFQLDGVRDTLEAQFKGLDDRWQLVALRRRNASEATAWEDVGAMLGRMRREAVDKAATTREILTDLAGFLDRYAVEHGSRFPATSATGLREVVVGNGYVTADLWRHGTDGWGNALVYHASPDGSAYVLLSPGADGQLDRPEAEYFSNADSGLEAYAGRTTDPDLDFIVASGTLVQSFEP